MAVMGWLMDELRHSRAPSPSSPAADRRPPPYNCAPSAYAIRRAARCPFASVLTEKLKGVCAWVTSISCLHPCTSNSGNSGPVSNPCIACSLLSSGSSPSNRPRPRSSVWYTRLLPLPHAHASAPGVHPARRPHCQKEAANRVSCLVQSTIWLRMSVRPRQGAL